MKNDKTSLKTWAMKAINEAIDKPKSKVTAEDYNLLETIAFDCIEDGGLRGDVSTKWEALGGYTYVDIPDMYL